MVDAVHVRLAEVVAQLFGKLRYIKANQGTAATERGNGGPLLEVGCIERTLLPCESYHAFTPIKHEIGDTNWRAIWAVTLAQSSRLWDTSWI